MADFAAQIAAFAAKTRAKADAVVRQAVINAAQTLIDASPVATGRFVANWQYGAGSAPGGTLDIVDPGKSETLSRIVSAIPEKAAGQVHYLVNNLPYAGVLEYGGPTSSPHGMVAQAQLTFTDALANAAGGGGER